MGYLAASMVPLRALKTALSEAVGAKLCMVEREEREGEGCGC